MSTFYAYHGYRPVVHKGAYVHPRAVVIGNVEIHDQVYVGPCAVLRGDWGKIRINRGVNVQENCVLHVFPKIDTVLEEDAHVGHGAIIHSAHIGKNAMIGMNSVIMDRAYIADNCIVGAMAFVPTNFKCHSGELIVGNPARVVKSLSKEMIDWKREGTKIYQELSREGREAITACEPLTEYEPQSMKKTIDYDIWENYNRDKEKK